MGVSVFAKNSVFMEMVFPEDFYFDGKDMVCNNTNCIKHGKVITGKFCSECGSKAEAVKVSGEDKEALVRGLKRYELYFPDIGYWQVEDFQFAGLSPINPDALLFECGNAGFKSVLNDGDAILYMAPSEEERMIKEHEEKFKEIVDKFEEMGVDVTFRVFPYVQVSV